MKLPQPFWLAMVAVVSTAALVGCSSTGGSEQAANSDETANPPAVLQTDKAPKPEQPNPALAAFPMDTTVRFAFDSDELSARARQGLTQLLKQAQQYDDITLHAQVDGYTDATGPGEYNQTLSRNRANKVVDYLKSESVQVANWQVNGHGQSSPVADNNTSHGRELNRRVEVKLMLQNRDNAHKSATRPAGQ